MMMSHFARYLDRWRMLVDERCALSCFIASNPRMLEHHILLGCHTSCRRARMLPGPIRSLHGPR
jgi:hypothetical protein